MGNHELDTQPEISASSRITEEMLPTKAKASYLGRKLRNLRQVALSLKCLQDTHSETSKGVPKGIHNLAEIPKPMTIDLRIFGMSLQLKPPVETSAICKKRMG